MNQRAKTDSCAGSFASAVVAVTAVFFSTLVHEGAKEGVAFISGSATTTAAPLAAIEGATSIVTSASCEVCTTSPAPPLVCPPCPGTPEGSASWSNNSTAHVCELSSAYSISLIVAWVGSVAAAGVAGRVSKRPIVLVPARPTVRVAGLGISRF